MSNGVQSFLASIVIALFGLLPLGLMAMGSSSDLAAEPVMETTAVTPATERVVEAGAQTIVTTPTPKIAGVSDEVARVLAANGFAAEEAVEGIPDSIVRLLSESGAVLTIAVDGEG